jgi:predicted transcriptional regulator
MTGKTCTIEVDETTAAQLKTRAEERGVSVSELVTELISLDSAPIAVGSDDIAELDRRWAAIEAGRATVPNEEVVRWLRTWGTPGFRRWRER